MNTSVYAYNAHIQQMTCDIDAAVFLYDYQVIAFYKYRTRSNLRAYKK